MKFIGAAALAGIERALSVNVGLRHRRLDRRKSLSASALSLYLNFINLFMLMLRLAGVRFAPILLI
jgi:hypothetical protein